MANLLALTIVPLLVAGIAGFAAASDGDQMTICHIPPGHPENARTEQIPASAWSGHKGHGDHEGACTGSEDKTGGAGAPPGKPIARTQVALRDRGEGDLDGDATFYLTVANGGPAVATGLKVSGAVRGDGDWSLLRTDGAACTIDGSRLACTLDDLPAGASFRLHLAFDGHLAVCDHASIDLSLSAANDSSSGDDRARETVKVGACSPLDPPSA